MKDVEAVHIDTYAVAKGVMATAPSRITVRLKDGREACEETRYPKGQHEAPMTGAEIEDKFRRQFSAYRDDAAATAMIDLIGRLETVDDVEAIFAAFG
jgi:2-methylcitrate dehydratase PrpD